MSCVGGMAECCFIQMLLGVSGGGCGEWGSEAGRSEGSRALSRDAAFPGALPVGFTLLLQIPRDIPCGWGDCGTGLLGWNRVMLRGSGALNCSS